MGSRDHSITCETCGLQRGGLNDYRCLCDERTITDPVLMISLTFGVGPDNRARISWSSGACMVEAGALVVGRWIPVEDPVWQTPPVEVVCRATAIAVHARIKENLIRALEDLP